MTIAQRMRLAGFIANRNVRGRWMAVFAGDDRGKDIQAIVEDAATEVDMTHTAQASKTIYSWIHALSGEVDDPRAVTKFQEIGDDGKPSGRFYTVSFYDEKAADAVIWKWKCEAQRQN